jgi:O-methyltransferase involved in polyketide biosynthesis
VTDSARGSDAISPTAHYTAYVWARHGLSHPALSTNAGRLAFLATQPAMLASRALGGPTLEDFLLARHRLIDLLLETAIERGRVSQVLEVACGLSPRGWRFARSHGDGITYVEADLPAMAARKREALKRAGTLGAHHRVVEIDALSDEGTDTIAAVASELEPAGGLAIITEGLLSYLDSDGLAGLWHRCAETLGGFSDGVYLSDIHLAAENEGVLAGGFLRGLSTFVRGQVTLHFRDQAEAQAALRTAGFTRATLRRPLDFADRIQIKGAGAALVRVIEAGVGEAAAA